MKRLRISAISYLNTAPLMWDFEHGEQGAAFDISYTVPSQCAADLAAGSADIGIIPAAAYASIPGLAILPGVAIASRRPVRSILLVSKVPAGPDPVGRARYFFSYLGGADQSVVREMVGPGQNFHRPWRRT